MADFGIERRRAERRVLRTNATVILGEAQSFEVRTMDISIGGMAIAASANPRSGTVFDIRFVVPLKPKGQAIFEAKVRVVHSVFSSDETGFKVGLSFVDLTPEAAAVAQNYLG